MEVPKHSSDHARHPSDGLQEDKSDHPLGLGQGLNRINSDGGVFLIDRLLLFHAGEEVHSPSAEPHKLPSSPIANRLGFTMSRDHIEHLLFGVAMMRPTWQGLADILCLLDGEEVSQVCYRRSGEISRGSMLLNRD